MRHAARTDANHAEIVAAFRRLGWAVWDTSRLGAGGPDLVVSRAGTTCLIEVKTEKGKLRPAQTEFLRTWQGSIWVVRSLEDVLHVGAE